MSRTRTRTASQTDVLLVCSSGGHLLQLVTLASSWNDLSRVWVSFDKSDVRSLLSGEEVITAHGPTNRNLPNLLRNLWLAQKVIRHVRPRAVVTTGAGVAVPFAWFARLVGARVVYVESFTRIDSISLSCRLIRPIADRVYVQWPEAVEPRQGRAVCGERLLRRAMIVVSVGTNEARFDRLLEWVSRPRNRGGPRRPARTVVGSRPGATCVAYMPYEDLVELVRKSRMFVTHAGVGSIMMSLFAGRRPVVVPRLKRFGEAVDDHQSHLRAGSEDASLVTLADTLDGARQRAIGRGAPRRSSAGRYDPAAWSSTTTFGRCGTPPA